MIWANQADITGVLDEYCGASYEQIMDDGSRGTAAGRLLELWEKSVQFEAVNETDYSNERLLGDLVAAMKLHGEPGFDTACAEFGRRMVMAAIDYVITAHEAEIEDLEARHYHAEWRE